MKLNFKNIGFAVILSSLLLTSCGKEEGGFPREDGNCQVTLRLDISSFGLQGGGMTKSVAGNTDEDRVVDLWVFQYNYDTGVSLKDPVYIGPEKLHGDIKEIEIDFQANQSEESSRICVVANTHDEHWAHDENEVAYEQFNTYVGLLEQALPSSASQPIISSNLGDDGGETIPMYGESSEIVIATKTYIRVPLVRMFAKVDVFVDPSYPHQVDMSIDHITYSNIPLYSRIGEINDNAEYPEDAVSWEEKEMGNADEYILYIPENIQGTVAGMTDKMTATEDQIPEKALAIKIEMKHQDHTHTYTVYPGMDMVNDFNIKRNHVYKVIIKITSDPSLAAIQQ